jgi:plexin A
VQYNISEEELISHEVIGAISAVTAILVAIGIVILIVLKHKSSQVEREYKRIQIQMDLLENNVRSECKQAFAELQTDITDLTMELETSGVPFVAHRKYVMNVFFPGVIDHPVLLKQLPEWQNGNSMFGFSMVQFEQLLMNKTFIVTLIDTVEKQPSFGIRDRVNFASLLSVVLMTKMDYFTDVLKCLLVRLMDKSLCSRHPQLMLRRTETIVEKLLTNWLALCMYGYVESRAGSSLFLLYKAIKYQVEKGPVDIYTQESKYSLSEEGLLRESCDYTPVTCLVMQPELDEAYQAKVLDCDSITQVKAKILDAVYKNTPFSARPNAQEIDLEMAMWARCTCSITGF